jgi:putative nucleotidyltransferase with HDIG domain
MANMHGSQKARQRIRDSMPELNDISSDDLRERVIDAWILALDESSFDDINEIPGEPEVTDAVNQVAHQRAVARMALALGDIMHEIVPTFTFDRDVVIAGALAHDVGKAYEYDPARGATWRAAPSRAGYPAIRHPVYGVHLALMAGLPEEVVHICGAHSREGAHVQRSLEGTLVHYADYAFWDAMAKAESGLTIEDLQRKALPGDGLRAVHAKFRSHVPTAIK